MTRQVIVSDGAYARLCEMAAAAKRETGRAAEFAEVIDALLEGPGTP